MKQITLETSAVPKYNAERLACAALTAIKRSLAQSNGAERLEKYAEQYYKRKTETNNTRLQDDQTSEQAGR